MSLYKTLLSVAVEHSYNSGGVCSSLDFHPARNTREIIDKAGLLLRKTLDGIQIIYDQDRLDALEMLLDEPEAPAFDFKVSSRDPDFRNYTEPYSGARDALLYFDNRAAGTSGKQAVSAAEFVCERDIRPVDSANLSGVLSHQDRLLPPDFVLRIFAENEAGPLLGRWLEQPPTIYSIRFKNRQRYWKYYLLGKLANRDMAQTRYSIVDPDNRFEFETMGQEILADRNLAFTFRSKQQIPLYEQYPFRFQLRQTGGAGESTLIPSLPLASVTQVGSDAIEGQEIIVSEIYVNS